MDGIILKKGSKGKLVEEIQKALGIKADGVFGEYTEAAVKHFQRMNNLTPDGIVGEKTLGLLISKFNLDADRFGINDSELVDTDNKLKYLGKYRTQSGLLIDRVYLDSDEYIRDFGKIQPRWLFLHHTAGWENPYAVVDSWNRDNRGRVATQYVIGGINIKTGNTQYDGVVVECFPDNYTAYHLGSTGSYEMNIYSCGIEICNFGPLTKKGNKFYNYIGLEVPEEFVCDLGFEFRGFRYYHKYTDKQLESLRLLIEHIKNIYPLIKIKQGLSAILKRKDISIRDAFEFRNSAYHGKIEGVWSHTNVRKDKFDVFPQNELVSLLRDL